MQGSAPGTTPSSHVERGTPPAAWAAKRATSSWQGAADREAFAVALRERLLDRRVAQVTALDRKFLQGDLAPGVDADEAGQRYAALVSPELYHLVIEELGWTRERHRRWLGRLLQSELLAPDT